MFGGLAFTGNEMNEGTFMGKTFPEWYDAVGKMMAAENVPMILSMISKVEKVGRIPIVGLGIGMFVTATILDYNAVQRGEISKTKAAVNFGFGVLGLIPNGYTVAASSIYSKVNG